MKWGVARRAVALSAALFSSAMVTVAHAAEPLVWDPAWPKFRPSEYVITGLAGGASMAIYLGVRNAREPRWTGGILFDEPVRRALRLSTIKALGTARFSSDLTGLALLTWTINIDSLAVPLIRRKPGIAGQMLLMDAEAFALSTLLANSIFKIVGRARPSYEACRLEPSFDSLCNINDTSSFPSGHANFSFTSAGLSCAHHVHLALYGERAADLLACGGSLALAVTTSSLRLFGDRHYASDVLVGAMIGFAIGYGVPTLLHYQKTNPSSAAATSGELPLVNAAPLGPTFSGTF